MSTVRSLFETKTGKSIREKLGRTLAGEERIGRKLADDMLSEVFSELSRIEKNINDKIEKLDLSEIDFDQETGEIKEKSDENVSYRKRSD